MTTATPTTTKTTIKAIGQFTRKAVKFIFKTIAAAALATIVLIIIVPTALFAWRATQPLNDPMFNRLSLYEVTLLRYSQYQEFTTQYNATHPFPQYPGQKKLATPELCFWTEVGYEVTALPIAAFCSASSSCNGGLPYAAVTTSPTNYLRTAWENYEYAIAMGYKNTPNKQAAACRLPPTFPTQETSQLGE